MRPVTGVGAGTALRSAKLAGTNHTPSTRNLSPGRQAH